MSEPDASSDVGARRIAVVGPPGSGKTTLARTLAAHSDLGHIDLDELFHGPDWSEPSTPVFRHRVAEALAHAEADRDGWAVSGNYSIVADLTQGRADTIVWLDLPRRVTVSRVVRRSVRRVARREQLWAGNRETVRALVSPSRSIIVEAWRKHPLTRDKYETLATTPLWAGAQVHRLRSTGEVTRLVQDNAALRPAGR